MASSSNRERPQRPGEELDMLLLQPWLDQHFPALPAPSKITQFAGGASNWTYRLQYPYRDLILRRAPLGKKAKGAHDMVREYSLQKSLKPAYDYVPEMLALCEDDSVMGSPFYIMERLEGLIPRKNLPNDLDWDAATVKQVCNSFWDKLIELHQVDTSQAELAQWGKGEGYIERQIHGWNKRYTDAVTWNVPSGKKVRSWLEQQLPKSETACMIHNDFRLDNVVLQTGTPPQITGILDWEMATIGDPLMDLGNSLAYWIEAGDDFFITKMRLQPSHLKGMMTRKEIIDYYVEKRGIEIDDFRFYRVYGMFRLAGIVQQIYYRYSKGYTRNQAFKKLWMLSFYLVKSCENVIRKG